MKIEQTLRGMPALPASGLSLLNSVYSLLSTLFVDRPHGVQFRETARLPEIHRLRRQQTEEFPRGYGFLVDQLNRAALSIAANIAEGNGRFTKPDRRNFFGIARGSVQECVPLLELALRRKLLTEDAHGELTRRLEEIARMLKLGEYHRRFLEHWTNCQAMGRKSLETLPYVMWWFEQNRDQCMVPHRTEVWNRKVTLRCEVGRPSLGWMLGKFASHPKLKRQCLIPHFKRKGPNELLVFERGSRWEERKSTKSDLSDFDDSAID